MDNVVLHYDRFRLDDDEFFNFCTQNGELKFERDAQGNIFIMPNTGGETGIKNAELNAEITLWNRLDKRGVVFDSSTAFRLPTSSVRSPDAAWVLKTRWEALTDKERKKFPPICPDFVIELMSETDALKESQDKIQHEWIAGGCRLAWLIDPKSQTVTIYRGNGEVQILKGFDRLLSGEDVLVGFELDLRLLIQ